MATQTHEFKAKTVDDAIDEGLRTLALSRSEVDVEIVHKGSRGIFGIGSEQAVVRLTLRTAPVSPVVPVVTEAPVIPPVTPEPVTPPITEPAHEPAVVDSEEVTETLLAIDAVPAYEAPAATVADITPVSVAETAVTSVAAVTESTAEADLATESVDATAVDGAESDQALIDMATDLLGQMIQLMGFEAQIQASWQEDDDAGADQDEEQGEEAAASSGRYLLLDIVGTELGALIGRRGETLENIQYLLRLMVNQKIHQWKNIVVDVEYYKARRVTQLTQLATRMAEQVERTGRAMSLEPMPSNERRIVHMALREHPGVFTESHGDGGRRKVHIVAKS